MFEKFFASIGIGSTQVDLQLDQNKLTMGQTTSGSLHLLGGNVSQEMESLVVHLYVKYKYIHSKRRDYTNRFSEIVTSIPIKQSNFRIEPRQEIHFPFSFDCPENLAVSSKMTEYYFCTELKIRNGKNSGDTDPIQISASGLMKHFLEGCKSLKMSWIHEGYTGSKAPEPKQFIYFLPPRIFRDRIQEILFEFNPHDTKQGIYGTYQIIKKGEGGESSLLKDFLPNTNEHFHFSPNQLATIETATESIKRWIALQAVNLPRS
jgi:sporulation-control protein